MSIFDIINEGIELKNQGRYIDSMQIFNDVASKLSSEQGLSALDLSVASWEMAKINFIIGDYALSAMLFNKSCKLIESFDCTDMPFEVTSYVKTAKNVMNLDLSHAKSALESFNSNELYENYSIFRAGFDPFYKENGDFDLCLLDYMSAVLADENIVLKTTKSVQFDNDTYLIEYIGDDFSLSFAYVKDCYKMGELTRSAQIRIINISLSQRLRGKQLSKIILNALTAFCEQVHATLWLTRFSNKSWSDYLIENGAIAVGESSDDLGPLLKIVNRLDIKPNSNIPKLWTIQKREILDLINQNGIYYPDFKKSPLLEILPDLSELYSLVLDAYNKINDTNADGLIFSFFCSDDNGINYINDFDEFKLLMQGKSSFIKNLWNMLIKDAVILEIEYDPAFNPLFVDINDFQTLIPPITLVEPYNVESINQIIINLENGIIEQSPMPSNIIQGHTNCIKKEQILNIYPSFEL